MTVKKIRFTETVLRDANQSLMATRLPFQVFEDVLPLIDKAGYETLECWGGATFDSCLRYLDEDPWERLRKIKDKVKTTKLQMLLRGQNLLGYKHYPDDVVRAFIERSVANGIDVIRIFDALNDLRNLETAVSETLKHKAEAQVAISYTTSPIHSVEKYAALSKEIEDMGANSICIKDMAGVMGPGEAYELITAIKESTKLSVHLHTHCTTGLGYMTYMKAAEAGADVIDTAISSFSGGTSQPATESVAYALSQLGYDTGLDFAALKNINDFFKPVKETYIKNGTMDAFVLGTDTDALSYQVPGGMLSNLIAQLKSQNAIDRLDEVLAETPRVRADLGYPPLVTPLSQMVGVQAANNVLSGNRYKNIGKEIRAYIRGEYGKAPGKIDEALINQVLGDDTPITCRFADTLEPGMPEGKLAAGMLAVSEEDVLSYVLFPQITETFFKSREDKKQNRRTYKVERID